MPSVLRHALLVAALAGVAGCATARADLAVSASPGWDREDQQRKTEERMKCERYGAVWNTASDQCEAGD